MRTRPVLLTTAMVLVAVLGTAGCAAAGASDAAGAPDAAGASGAAEQSGSADVVTGAAGGTAYTNLPTSGRPDYQLGGSYTPPSGVTIVERDSTARPAAGKYSICYVNGFQTQPEAARSWTDSYPSAILRDRSGEPVSDPGWPDEMLLDTRTAAKRALITTVLAKTIARCGDRGFDAVEFDNLDSWTRSDGRLTRAGNLALAGSLVAEGHRHGLAVGQKNTPELGASGREQTGFDFVVAEECVQYQECSAYTKAYGGRVIDIEYADTTKRSWSSICAQRDRPAMTILRDRDLVSPSDDEYVFRHC